MLVALLLLVQQPNTVTFTHPCAHSSVVLEALGKEMGVKMAPGGSVLQDYFALKFTDRPVEDVKRVIAETLNAEWVHRGEYLVLDRGPAQLAEERKLEDAALRLVLEKYVAGAKDKKFDVESILDRARTFLKSKEYGEGSNTEFFTALQTLMPSSFLGPQIVEAVGVDHFVALDNGDVETFTMKTDGAGDMPRALANLIRDYVGNTIALNEAARSIGAENLFSDGGFRDLFISNETSLELRRVDGQITVSLLERGHFTNGTKFSTVAVPVSISSRLADPPRLMIEQSTSGKIEFEGTASRVVSVVRERLARSSTVPLEVPREETMFVRNLATDLSKNELMSFHGDSPIRAVAAIKGRDYVALVADVVLTGYWIEAARLAQIPVVFNMWASRVQEDSQTGILMLRPHNTNVARRDRFDRHAVSRFVASFVTGRRLTLDSVLSLALASDTTKSFQVDRSVARLFLPIRNVNFGDWIALRFYSSLGSAQKRLALTSGLHMNWRSIPSTVRKALGDILVGQRSMYVPEPRIGVSWSTFGRGGVYYGTDAPLATTVKEVPQSTEVIVRHYHDTLLKPKPGKYQDSQLMTAVEIAMNQRIVASDFAPDYRRVILVNADRIQVDVFVPGLGYTTFTAQVDDSTDESEYVTFDKLPEPWRSQLAEAIKKAGGGE